MRKQQTQLPVSKVDNFNYQPSTDYTFKTCYQYQGSRKAEAISQNILNDFILPSWVQRYLTIEEFRTDNTGTISKEVVSNYLNMLDCRTFSLRNQDGKEKIQLSFLDKNELKQFKILKEMNQQFVGEPEVENFRKEAISLYTKWENFLKLIQTNERFSSILIDILRKTKVLKIYICQRLFRGESKIKEENQETNQLNHSHKIGQKQPDQFVDDEFFYFRDSSELINSPKNIVFKEDQRISSYYQTNWFIPCFQKPQNVEEPYKINLKITFQKQLPIDYDRKILYYRIPQNQNVKLLKIVFEIEDKKGDQDKFFTKRLKVDYKKDTIRQLECFNQVSNYAEIPSQQNRNKATFPYQQPKFQRNKINLFKHFHLAFQGGGAKGLAYVGAYKSIREQKIVNPFKNFQNGKQEEEERIPIKSIMGSSAGGIIALGISTGIPEYQLQKICYKMNSIPSMDRFYTQGDEVPENLRVKAYDDYGNQITMQTVKESFTRILDQYGILQKGIVQKLFKFISESEQSKEIQDKLLNWLAINSNAMAQILTLQRKDKVQPSRLKKLFGSKTQQITRKVINWQGLLLHGALMKGQAIYDIAKDCLVKFLYKQVMYVNEKEFIDYLKACEDTQQREEKFKYKADNINHFLQKQITLSRMLLKLKLKDIYQGFAGDNDAFGTYLIGIINRFIVLIDNYHKLWHSQKRGLILFERQSLIDISALPFKDGFGHKGLIQYFKNCYLKQNNIRPEDVKIQQSEESFYLQKLQSEGTLDTQQGQIRYENCRKASKIFRDIHKEHQQKLSYSEINSLLKTQNLIDPSHLDFKNFKGYDSNQTLLDFLLAIFREQLDQMAIDKILQDNTGKRFQKVNQQTSDQQLNSFFYSLEAAQSIYEVYGLLKSTVKDLKEVETPFNQAIKDYEGNMRQFKEQVAKINMREYYRLTGIELGCTSVDLDNKVLRFFNQKTTPLLPVCRAVQMTGSFPVGFKAQKWRKEWGLYHVYSLQNKHVIDITGHQFTDGGLLANFPIKYMDNDLIRKRYFSHKAVNGATILLGFGLDYLQEDRYELTQKQIQSHKEQKNKSAIAMQQLKNIFGLWASVSGGLSAFFSTSEGKQTSSWSQIEHWMIKEIPLLRFGLKIVQAYPNADRNLNLQAFDNKVLVQEMWPDWKIANSHEKDKKSEDKAFIKQINDIFHLHLKPKYHHNQDKNLQNLSKEKFISQIQKYGKQVNFFIRQRQIDINDRNKIIQDQFNALFKQSNIKKFKDLLGQCDKPNDKGKLSSTLSLSIVNIFFIHLRIKENKEVVQRYNKFYAFMKFIAEDFTYQKTYQSKSLTITTSQNIAIEQDLNRINFQHLYQQQNFNQIAKHLGFEGYYNQYYSEFVKKYEQALNSQNGQKFKNDKRNQTEKKIKKQYSKDAFYEIKLFDVTESIKRLTQLIYLLVKGRDKSGKLKGVAQIRKLTQHVKSTNYIDLFYNGKNKSQREEDPEPLYYCQIIDFFKKQFKQFQNNSLKLNITDSFYNFINQYDFSSHENMKIRYLEGIIKHKNSQKIALNSISQQKQKQIDDGTKKWLAKQYKFVLKFKSKQALLKRMQIMLKEEISKNINNGPTITAKTLFEILYQRKPKQSDKNDKDQLKQLDQLLIFIFDQKVNIEQLFGVSIQKEENIKRTKKAALETLLSLFKSYAKTESLPQEINFMKDIINKDTFINQINEKIPALKPQLPNENSDNLKDKQPGQIDSFSLTLVQLQVIYWCVDSKLKIKFQEALKTNGNNYGTQKLKVLQQYNNAFFYDMKYLLSTLKQMIFLTQSILYEDVQTKSESSSVSIIQTFKRHQIAKQLIQIYKKILTKFIPKYYALEDVSLSELGKSKLSQPFIIEFQKSRKLSLQIYKIIQKMYIKHCKPIIQKSQSQLEYLSESKSNHEENVVRYLYSLLAKMVRHKFSLPLLDIQWELSVQSTGKYYQQKVFNILALQAQKKSNEFTSPVLRYKEVKEKVFKPCENRDVDSDVHLILEGVQSSNKYFGGLYQNIGNVLADKISEKKKLIKQKKIKVKIQEKSQQEIKPKTIEDQIGSIKAITCANFHSVFGFLLCMGFSLEQIRKQMFKLKYITNSIENQAKTEAYFNSYAWANNSSHRHKVLLEELQKNNTSFFDRIDTLRRKDYQCTLLPKEFEEIKLIYQHEKEMILETEARIIDQAADSIKQISGNFQSDKYVLQLSKKFGYDYVCNLQHRHQYKKLSQNSFNSFRSIVQMIYDTLGTLIQGIICNSIASNTSISVIKQNAKYVTKGLLINKLLTTFKLNSYITKKLKESRLSPNISLAQFYQVSKRKIFLNFTVIDVNRERLAFLNKNTMPNMPLWAAIIATSSLPFFHQFFQANKEWQATDASSFYDFFIYQFFKADQDKNTRITQYTSGNFISSVPLQLLTNNTLRKKIFDPVKDRELFDIPQFAICFNSSNESNKIVDVDVKKKYINISVTDVLKAGMSKAWQGIKNLPGTLINVIIPRKNAHENETYNISYSPTAYLGNWLNSTTFMKTFSILSNSNDNLILKWYYDKLIRLPIKIGTLDFHEIVEGSILDRFKVNVLSEKAQQTVERSYEITNSFIFNIVKRTFSTIQWKEKVIGKQKTEITQQSSEPSVLTNATQSSSIVERRQQSLNQIQQSIKKILEYYKRSQVDRFKIRFRIQLYEKAHPITGFKRLYFKLNFLNHSKWNHNNYNNFVVQYSVDEGQDLYGNRKCFKRAEQSEIIWLVQSNTVITLRFFYLLKESSAINSNQKALQILTSKNYQSMQIRETQMQLDFKDIIKKLPLRDSYDYEFYYGWEKNYEPKWEPEIIPIKRNKLSFTQKGCEEDAPKLKLKLIEEESHEQLKTKHIIKKTTHYPKQQVKQTKQKQFFRKATQLFTNDS